MPCGATKTGRSWWRGLTEGDPLEKVMANHFTCIIINPCMTRQISESCCESIWKNVFWVCSLVCILDHTLSWTGSMEPEIGTLKEIKGLLLFWRTPCSGKVSRPKLGPREKHHLPSGTASLPCPSSSPGACPSSCSLTRWCHQTISSSVAPISSCPQSFPVSGPFLMSQLFSSGGPIGAQENKICHCFHFFPSILAKDLWLTLFQETTLILSPMTY